MRSVGLLLVQPLMLLLELKLRLASSIVGQRHALKLLLYYHFAIGLLPGCIRLILAITDLGVFNRSVTCHLCSYFSANWCLLRVQVDNEGRISLQIYIALTEVVGGVVCHIDEAVRDGWLVRVLGTLRVIVQQG